MTVDASWPPTWPGRWFTASGKTVVVDNDENGVAITVAAALDAPPWGRGGAEGTVSR